MHPLLDSLPDQIAVLDTTGTITSVNKAWRHQYENSIGLNFIQFYEQQARQPKTKKIRQIIQKMLAGEITRSTSLFKQPHCCHSMHINPMADQDTGQIMVTLHDITTVHEQSHQEITRLRETNIALNTLLKSRENDRATLEGAIATNVNQLIMPYINRLEQEPLAPHQQTFLTIIKDYLDNLVSPFLHRLSSVNNKLTPQELRIASLIRQGRSTKQIAEALSLTVNGVGFHRKSIRTKLGLTGSGKNLRSQLMALQ